MCYVFSMMMSMIFSACLCSLSGGVCLESFVSVGVVYEEEEQRIKSANEVQNGYREKATEFFPLF